MIQLNKDLRNWIKYSIRATGKTRKEISDEIGGVCPDYLTKMTMKNTLVGAEAVIKVLKYLNYPNLDKLNLEDKKLYKTNSDFSYNQKVAELIKEHGLSITCAANICGYSRQRMFSIIKENCSLTKNKAIEIMDKIKKEMEKRAGQQA